MINSSTKLTILYDQPFWVGIFEREEQGKYSVAKVNFGIEPTDPEVLKFFLSHLDSLKFTTPQDEKIKEIKINPKRRQREIKKETKKIGVISKAQDALRVDIEKNKKIIKEKSKEQKEIDKKAMFNLKREKKKKKIRGH